MAAARQRLHGDRGGRSARRGRCRRCRARQGQQSRAAARRAAGAQGHVLRRRQGRDLRLEDPPRFRADDDLDRVAAAEGRRHRQARLAADGGVRLRPDRPQSALRRGAQSLECRSHHRRLVVRLRLGGRRAADLCGARLRYRRLDPDARAFLRRHRLQDHGRPDQPRRRDAAVAVARYGRAAGANGRRLRAAGRADGRRRSRGSDHRIAAGAGLHGRDHGLAQGPQDRRAHGLLCRRSRCRGGAGARRDHRHAQEGGRRDRQGRTAGPAPAHRRLPARARHRSRRLSTSAG